MKKVLLTGSTGFVGSALYTQLVRQNYDVLGVSRNPTTSQKHSTCDLANDDISKIQSIVNNHNPEIIFHFAANPLVRDYTHDISKDNILGTHKLLDCCPPGCMFFLASSATVYGKHNTSRWPYSNTKPQSVYGWTKLYCEQLVKLYYEQYKKISDYRIARFCAHVGPNSTHGLVHDIVNKLKSNNPVLELLGTAPGPKKPFIHIDDSIRAIIELTDVKYAAKWSKIHNISPCDNMSVLEVAETVMKRINITKPIKFLGRKSNWAGDNRFVKLYSQFAFIRNSKEAIESVI